MKREEISRSLIDGTIRVIAREGLDKASTKQIGRATSMNEAYIYRYFADKDDLFSKAFDVLDEELLAKKGLYYRTYQAQYGNMTKEAV